ncbi:MAG: hypothetical protein U0893_11045 [Chloroflexota bacterium]
MRRDAPFSLLAATAASIVFVNVVLAQLLVQVLSSEGGFRVGPAVLVALVIAAVGSAVYAAFGWRAYFRERPDKSPD